MTTLKTIAVSRAILFLATLVMLWPYYTLWLPNRAWWAVSVFWEALLLMEFLGALSKHLTTAKEKRNVRETFFNLNYWWFPTAMATNTVLVLTNNDTSLWATILWIVLAILGVGTALDMAFPKLPKEKKKPPKKPDEEILVGSYLDAREPESAELSKHLATLQKISAKVPNARTSIWINGRKVYDDWENKGQIKRVVESDSRRN